MKIIELQGVNYVNKGAHLMLDAVVDHLAAKYPDLKIGLPFRSSTFRERNDDGLAHIMYVRNQPAPAINSAIDFGCRLLRPKLRNKLSIARQSDVVCVLDASGFLYSDQWGSEKIHRMNTRVESLTKEGIPVIFLPQAFGPFRDHKTKLAIKRLVENSSLFFGRDDISMEHLIEAAGPLPQLHKAPDFTNLVAPPPLPKDSLPSGALLIVPNSRMLDKTESSVADQYLPQLIRLISTSRAKGFNPLILVHDTNEDIILAKRIQTEFSDPIDIIEVDDPLQLKSYLAAATLVVGSRFHALVGALSSGTPSVAIGWSHKYDELMKEYGSSEFSVKIGDFETLEKIVKQCANSKLLATHANVVTQHAKQQKQKSSEMWEMVDEILNAVQQQTN